MDQLAVVDTNQRGPFVQLDPELGYPAALVLSVTRPPSVAGKQPKEILLNDVIQEAVQLLKADNFTLNVYF